MEKNISIKLTENWAMYPAASVCGWYFSHPESKYFSVGNLMNEASGNLKVKPSPSSKEIISL